MSDNEEEQEKIQWDRFLELLALPDEEARKVVEQEAKDKQDKQSANHARKKSNGKISSSSLNKEEVQFYQSRELRGSSTVHKREQYPLSIKSSTKTSAKLTEKPTNDKYDKSNASHSRRKLNSQINTGKNKISSSSSSSFAREKVHSQQPKELQKLSATYQKGEHPLSIKSLTKTLEKLAESSSQTTSSRVNSTIVNSDRNNNLLQNPNEQVKLNVASGRNNENSNKRKNNSSQDNYLFDEDYPNSQNPNYANINQEEEGEEQEEDKNVHTNSEVKRNTVSVVQRNYPTNRNSNKNETNNKNANKQNENKHEENKQKKQKLRETNDDEKERITRSERAGITLPVSRFNRHLRRTHYVKRIGNTASVYLTSVIEYILAEILELAGNVTLDEKRKRLNARDIMLAVKQDEELDAFLGRKMIIASAGVVPQNAKLGKIKSKKKRKHSKG